MKKFSSTFYLAALMLFMASASKSQNSNNSTGFTATATGNTVEFKWAITGKDSCVDHFTIERSKNQKLFIVLREHGGLDRNTGAFNYSDTDTRPLKGITYYRLKQTNADGRVKYSEPVPVFFEKNGNSSISTAPASETANTNEKSKI